MMLKLKSLNLLFERILFCLIWSFDLHKFYHYSAMICLNRENRKGNSDFRSVVKTFCFIGVCFALSALAFQNFTVVETLGKLLDGCYLGLVWLNLLLSGVLLCCYGLLASEILLLYSGVVVEKKP